MDGIAATLGTALAVFAGTNVVILHRAVPVGPREGPAAPLADRHRSVRTIGPAAA
ncbi:hypothetical protein ACGFIJ_25605 [Microbispora bryophytorum]|uniref:hypothetical protein n=1 Tax=Microbispora bryophytorum TaxID=1460882 RepID=UPI0037195A03